MTHLVGCFFDLFGLDYFGSWGPWLLCTPDLENYPAYNSHSDLSGVLYFLKGFKCMFTTANHQANNILRLEDQKRNENDQLKNHEPEVNGERQMLYDLTCM